MQYPETRNARRGEVEMVLTLMGKKFKRFDGDWLRLINSPCCGHDSKNNPSFSISNETGAWKCFKCSKTGNFVSFCRVIGHRLVDDGITRRDVINYTTGWEDHFFRSLRTPLTVNKYADLLKYCNQRGISNKTLDAFRVVSKGNSIIQIPIFSWHDDKWVRVNARNIKVLRHEQDEGPKNWFEIRGGPTHLMMGNHLLDLTVPEKRVFIFEGQWDMMTAYEIGLRNVFSLPNGATNVACATMLQYIPSDWEIFICMDMDEAGYEATLKFFCQIGSEKFRRLVLPHKDLNDWLMEKPDLTSSDVMKTAQGLDLIPDVGCGNVLNDGIDIDEVQEDDEKPIYKAPWQQLNDYLLGGFFPGQTTSLLAPSGSGKTTVVNHMSLKAVFDGVKTGLISLEDTQKKLAKKLRSTRDMLQKNYDHKFDRSLFYATQINGSETTSTQLLTKVEAMISNGFELIIVDNVNHCGGDVRDQLMTFKNLMAMVDRKPIHIVMVVQPKKLDGDVETVNSGDMKGFSDVYQGVFNHLNLCKGAGDNDRFIHVEKCREKWPGRKANVYLHYDEKTHCYVSAKGPAKIAHVLRPRDFVKKA